MARTVDVFGFDELQKAFERCEKNIQIKPMPYLWLRDKQLINAPNHLLPLELKSYATLGDLKGQAI